jgi:hypothetical protein
MAAKVGPSWRANGVCVSEALRYRSRAHQRFPGRKQDKLASSAFECHTLHRGHSHPRALRFSKSPGLSRHTSVTRQSLP